METEWRADKSESVWMMEDGKGRCKERPPRGQFLDALAAIVYYCYPAHELFYKYERGQIMHMSLLSILGVI